MNYRPPSTALLGVLCGLLLASVLPSPSSDLRSPSSGASPVIVATPNAPHPQARIRAVDFEAGTIRFDWLDANGQPVDTGNSLAQVTVTGSTVTPEQKAILAAGITAATANP